MHALVPARMDGVDELIVLTKSDKLSNNQLATGSRARSPTSSSSTTRIPHRRRRRQQEKGSTEIWREMIGRLRARTMKKETDGTH